MARVGSSCENSDTYIASSALQSSFDIGEYRKQILSKSTPHIIECIEAGEGGSQEVCHLPRDKRYAAINQKGFLKFIVHNNSNNSLIL